MMAQKIPSPSTLKEAVETVIDQNKSIGYNPTRFTQMTQGGYADNLIEVCDRLIQRGETYEAVSDQLENHPDILTLGRPDSSLSPRKRMGIGRVNDRDGEGTCEGVGH